MKFLVLFTLFITFSAFGQVPPYLAAFDAKVYSLKTKGVKEFSVDIKSPKLVRQLNEQMIFGKVDNLIFRTYWTSSPERIAVEVVGLPEGFKEVKEELKLSIMTIMENLIPPTTAQKFAGYQLNQGSNPKEYLATDTTGVAAIPGFTLKFDGQDKLIEVIGKKPVGTMKVEVKYEKPSFTDGKWALMSSTSTTTENGQSLVIRRELSYGTSQGVGVLSKVSITSEQKVLGDNSKPLISEEEIEFKDYQINTGVALKYFLGDQNRVKP